MVTSCDAECCRRFQFELKDAEHARLAEYFGMIVTKSEGRFYVVFDDPCQKLDEGGRCTIYETRPEPCRSFLCAEVRVD